MTGAGRLLALAFALGCARDPIPPSQRNPFDAGRAPDARADVPVDRGPLAEGGSATEPCNGLDDDRDGLVDEDGCPSVYPCAGAGCECGALRVRCGAVCTTLEDDPANCGDCGRACAADAACVAGLCLPSCGDGRVRCAASCVSLADDRAHCGACGRRCPANVPCVAGACTAAGATPVAGARLGTRRPTLRWSSPGAAVTLCADPACEQPLARLSDGTRVEAQAPDALAPGVYFWRTGDGRGPRSFRVDQRDAAVEGLLPGAPDLNGDGLADVVVACARSTRVWFGRRAALPATADRTLAEGDAADPWLRDAGDFDGDHLGDVFVRRAAPGLLVGRASAGELLRRATSLGEGVPVSDVNGDGRVDWLATGGAPTLVLLTELTERASVELALPAGVAAREVAYVGDVDGDGRGDVVAGAASLAPPRAYVVSGSATTAFVATPLAPAPRSRGFAGSTLAAGDVNGDGLADVLVGVDGGAAVYLGERATAPVFHRLVVGAGDEELLVAGAGDVDADGFGDVLAVVRARGELRLYRGSRAGLAGEPEALRDARWSAVEAIGVAGDRDGDGRDDVVLGAPSAGVIYVLYGATADALTRVEALRGDGEECGRSVL